MGVPAILMLPTYAGGAEDFVKTPLQAFIDELEAGRTQSRVGRVFNLDDIVEAHRCMEENRVGGKIVVLTGGKGS